MIARGLGGREYWTVNYYKTGIISRTKNSSLIFSSQPLRVDFKHFDSLTVEFVLNS